MIEVAILPHPAPGSVPGTGWQFYIITVANCSKVAFSFQSTFFLQLHPAASVRTRALVRSPWREPSAIMASKGQPSPPSKEPLPDSAFPGSAFSLRSYLKNN
jgi:hypothetical protein